MEDAERKSLLRALWLRRPQRRRTEMHVAIFYQLLDRTWPQLLRRIPGDPYQQLRMDLSGLIKR